MTTPVTPALSDDARALLGPWPGPNGGLPPWDRATPEAVEAALHAALAAARAEIATIVANPAPPGFENTVEALEDSRRALQRVTAVLRSLASAQSLGDMPAVAQRLAPLLAGFDDEVAHDGRLFARIARVWQHRAALDALPRRLVQVLHERFLRQGAGLAAPEQALLKSLNGRLAELSARYQQNLMAGQETEAVLIDDAAGLAGLPEPLRRTLAAAAEARGHGGRWAVPCLRPAVWPFLIHSTRRDLRERVWRLWAGRGNHAGAHDNKPVAQEILRLRGEKARLLGFASYAHLALADRMARTPEAALAVLQRTWRDVHAITLQQIAEMQALARRDDPALELAPWDRLHYAERLRQARFGLDTDALKAYLPLESMLEAMFWCAGRLHGLAFTPLPEAPRLHESVRVYTVSRRRDDGADTTVGTLFLDLFHRPGKAHGSYQAELRAAEGFRGRVLPVSGIFSTFPPPAAGEPVLLPFEYANVFFHEFGHALHILCNGAPYPSLGSLGVEWDFIELPALINERWLMQPEVLQRFARHHASGEPMPVPLRQSLEQSLRHDRVFALNLDFLAPAIVDLRLHLLADGTPGREIDVAAVEREALAELGMPAAWDQIMGVTNNLHCFAGAYAAGLYSYLWADVMAADAAEAFQQSPGGFFDAGTARRWHDSVLGAGSTAPADDAFRRFRGRDPDPQALLRRFGLEVSA